MLKVTFYWKTSELTKLKEFKWLWSTLGQKAWAAFQDRVTEQSRASKNTCKMTNGAQITPKPLNPLR